MIIRAIASLTIAVVLAAVTADAGQQPPVLVEQGPDVTLVGLPPIPNAHAIWGASGQDRQGRIWLGITVGGPPPHSAHLVEYDPAAGRITDRGDVVAELKRAGLWRPDEQQAKIHSRIIHGPGNYLYFASMDEEGENEDGSKLPRWGGHLWRLNLTTYRWEHLMSAPEALIAVGGGGRYIYALGYFGHVLYQFDTGSRAIQRVEVGSVDGHISRNFLVDHRGHAYVPRLVAEPASSGMPRRVTVALAEFSPGMRKIGETAIRTEHYLDPASPTASHGIVGLQTMGDGSMYFTTDKGYLARIVPPGVEGSGPVSHAPASVVGIGWFHPEGASYPASLFTQDGANTLAGVGRRPGRPFEWITCSITPSHCRAEVLDIPGLDNAALNRTLLYGSSTRDAAGGHYVVGISNNRPLLLRIQPTAQ